MEINQSYDAILVDTYVDIAPGWHASLARALSIVFSPPVVAVAAVGLAAAALNTFEGWLWAVVYSLVAVAVPVLFVWWLVSRGTVSDFDLRHREQRIVPYLVTLLYMGSALALLVHQHAPALFVAVATASLVEMALLFAVTLQWKISAHAAGVAGLAILALKVAMPLGLVLLVAVPAVAWARLRLRRHTLMQTVAGALSGVIVFVISLYWMA
jgi:membrane-associated phospholipid phosphatase